MSAILSYLNNIKNRPDNGLVPAPVKESGKWIVTCYCGSTMIPVLLPFPEYIRDCDIPDCPNCTVDRYNGNVGAFYSCTNVGCDGLHSAEKIVRHPLRGANSLKGDSNLLFISSISIQNLIIKVGNPLGLVAYPECQKLRHYVHIEFDHLWNYLGKTRQWGYNLLARMLELPFAETHMSKLGIRQSKKAIFSIRIYKIRRGIPLILPEHI